MFTRRIFGCLCTSPQFRLFSNVKRQQHIAGLQQKVFELRTLYQQAADPQSELQYLNELQQIHDQIVADQKGLCSEQLSDKLELAAVQLKLNDQLDEDLKKELLQLNLSELHFSHIIGPSLSKHVIEFLRHKLQYRLYRTRLQVCIHSNLSEAMLREYCEIFKQSSVFLHEYQRKHTTQLFQFEDQNFDLAQYHRFLGQIALKHNHIQEAITNFEQAITLLESSRDTIQRCLIKADSNSISDTKSKLQEVYHFIADVFKSLGRIKCRIGSLVVGRKYLSKSLKIFTQIFGIHSMQYATLYCDLAFTYKSEDLNLCRKMISDLFEILKDSENEQAFLHVCMVKYTLLSEENNSIELFILYMQITQKLQSIRVKDQQMEFLFHFVSISFTYHRLSQSQSYQHTMSALFILQQSNDSERSMQVLQLIEQQQKHKIDNQEIYLLIMHNCLKILENQSYRIELLKEQGFEQFEFQIKLFEIESWILRLKCMLWYQINIQIEDFRFQILQFINHFKRIPEMQIMLLQRVTEFVSYFNNSGFKEYAIELIDQMTKIAKGFKNQNTASEFQSQIQQLRIECLSN